MTSRGDDPPIERLYRESFVKTLCKRLRRELTEASGKPARLVMAQRAIARGLGLPHTSALFERLPGWFVWNGRAAADDILGWHDAPDRTVVERAVAVLEHRHRLGCQWISDGATSNPDDDEQAPIGGGLPGP